MKGSVYKTIDTKIRRKLLKVFVVFVIIIFFATICILAPIYSSVSLSVKTHNRLKDMNYILLWAHENWDPLDKLKGGQKLFIKNNCSAQNCFTTTNRSYFDDITKFHIVIFHAPEIVIKKFYYWRMPWRRSPDQKYVFASLESSNNYPVHDTHYNHMFNWTWTYKLNSDLRFLYLIIRDKQGNIIGPNENISWKKNEDLTALHDTIKEKLRTKSKAAAWFASNCWTHNNRGEFVKKLQRELDKYQLSIDIFGGCGNLSCPTKQKEVCYRMIERDYYFYLSFENSFSEDYVTEKLLHGLLNYAIPVVYGSANYSRFMPDGIYLNALKLGPKELANQMSNIINDKEKYYSFFKWHNHYSYHRVNDAPDSNNYCRLCAMLNDKAAMRQTTCYRDLNAWWNR